MPRSEKRRIGLSSTLRCKLVWCILFEGGHRGAILGVNVGVRGTVVHSRLEAAAHRHGAAGEIRTVNVWTFRPSIQLRTLAESLQNSRLRP
jgi:hypothetical protein